MSPARHSSCPCKKSPCSVHDVFSKVLDKTSPVNCFMRETIV